jgi:hypothetical protein
MCLPPMSFERTLLVFFLGRTKKAGRAIVFLYWHHRAITGLILPLHMMSFPSCMFYLFYFYFIFIFFLQKTKKKIWENLQDYFVSLGLLDIVCIFTCYLNSVSIQLTLLRYISQFYDYIGQVFFLVYAKVR